MNCGSMQAVRISRSQSQPAPGLSLHINYKCFCSCPSPMVFLVATAAVVTLHQRIHDLQTTLQRPSLHINTSHEIGMHVVQAFQHSFQLSYFTPPLSSPCLPPFQTSDRVFPPPQQAEQYHLPAMNVVQSQVLLFVPME